jgi:hypothetical protein
LECERARVCGTLTPQNAAFFTPKGAGAGRQISESPFLFLQISAKNVRNTVL